VALGARSPRLPRQVGHLPYPTIPLTAGPSFSIRPPPIRCLTTGACVSFQTPITIHQALSRIQARDYVLPAIQREFVWRQPQICALFDSLMQGYPIGAFLFWKIKPENCGDFVFYGFLRNYSQYDAYHCPKLDLPTTRGATAILDGQQRLTALNIGLRGSHAVKEPRKRWSNPAAYKKRLLHLNLRAPAQVNEQGMKFDFRFLTSKRAGELTSSGEGAWFPVSEVYDASSVNQVFKILRTLGLGNDEYAGDTLVRLWQVVHSDGLIPFFEVTSQDIDKVLNIFIRVNSGGTQLSYSDLLLSIATAQWRHLDAREAIHGLVDELNDTRFGFSFSKDLVLKAGLLLSDLPQIGFKVANFNAHNMAVLERNWQMVSDALRVAVGLLADFGFSDRTLMADSVVLPIAYYAHMNQLTDSYRTLVKHSADRDAIRDWVHRTMLRGGVWGSGLDGVLLALRRALQKKGKDGFPVKHLNKGLASRGKPIQFPDERVEHLLDSKYGSKLTFPLLAMLYPGVDLRNTFHVDHVVPRGKLTPTRLKKAGVPQDDHETVRLHMNRLANLQLLEGEENKSKSAKMPAKWLETRFKSDADRAAYRERHDLGVLPSGVEGFEAFYKARRARMKERLTGILHP